MWWRRTSNKKPKIQYDRNYEKVYITFHTGEILMVTKQCCETLCINVDDKIERAAYDISSLSQTAHLPRSIFCPISRMPMLDPVMCADGFSYERKDIITWMKKSKRSPVTNQDLRHRCITPNHALRNTISDIMHDNLSGCESKN